LQGFNYAFRGTAGPPTGIMAAVARELSLALVLTALGLAVALLAFWGCKHLRSKLEGLDREMKAASLELLNELGRFKRSTNI
jgi:biopolymer transport protein ExbB/TolQ